MTRFWVAISTIFFCVLVGMYAWKISEGYRDYQRALGVINNINSETEKEGATREFFGYEEHMYGGMLLATLPGHVWVMGRDGMRHFRTDQDTVYSAFDGCREEILKRLKTGEVGAVERNVSTEMSQWRKNVRLGDYVRVYVTTAQQIEDSRGVVGNLREIYGYNFWLFMRWGMEERCQAR